MYYEIESRFNMKPIIFDDENMTVGDRVYPYASLEQIGISGTPLFAAYGILKVRTEGRDISILFPRSATEKIRRALREIERERNKKAEESGSGKEREAARKDGRVPTDPYEEAKKLKELLDLGIITEEEFQRKKKEILGL